MEQDADDTSGYARVPRCKRCDSGYVIAQKCLGGGWFARCTKCTDPMTNAMIGWGVSKESARRRWNREEH